MTSGQDNKANLPSILRAGGGAANTSPVPPHSQIVAPSPAPAFVAPPPPPPPSFEAQTEFVTPPPPPGFVPPPPPPPPIAVNSEDDVSFPEPRPSYTDNVPAPDGYVPPPMPTFRDSSDGLNFPTPASDPPSKSSSPAIGGGNRPGAPQRTTSGLTRPRTGAMTRGPRTSGVSPALGRRESYGRQIRPHRCHTTVTSEETCLAHVERTTCLCIGGVGVVLGL